MLAADRGSRQRDVGNEVAGLKHGLAVRGAAGQKMKIAECYRSRTLRTLNLNGRIQSRQRYAHSGRIARDALVARSEDGQRPIVSGDGRTPGAGLALVARHRGVAEVDAASALKQVPPDSRHVADLRRGSLQ